MAKFYDREAELSVLESIEANSNKAAGFTVVTGRRRIGKTALLKKFMENKRSCYLFTSRSSEALLCEQWQKSLESDLGLRIYGRITSLAQLFDEIMAYSKKEHFILVIDEFQDLQSINSSFFSRMQNSWDANKDESKINLIVCGSVYSMMIKIFEDAKEPLFGRATAMLNLAPFKPSVCKTILKDYNPAFTNEDLLCLYMLSGGVAKYIFLLLESGSTSKAKMLDYVTGVASPFLLDGKELLLSEIGKDYGVYFSILALISRGMTSQREIDSIIEKTTGAYLANLEKVFNVIKPLRPLFSKPGSRNARWQITDSYLRFYFRFIYPNQGIIELGQNDVLKSLIMRDYDTFAGKTLEQYFHAKINEEKALTEIGGWWERKGENEIDVIALNEIEKTCDVYEVKLQKKKINLDVLAKKAEMLTSLSKAEMSGYLIRLHALSMDDM